MKRKQIADATCRNVAVMDKRKPNSISDTKTVSSSLPAPHDVVLLRERKRERVG